MRADGNGIVRTEPIETGRNGDGTLPAADVMDEQSAQGWNRWLSGHIEIAKEEIGEATGRVVGELAAELDDTIAVLTKKVETLQRELAEARGAIDILRGKGAPGMPRVVGTYIAGAAYNYLDVVACNGSSFVALKDAPGPCPGSGWQLLASAGRRGERGQRGPQGCAGADGRDLEIALGRCSALDADEPADRRHGRPGDFTPSYLCGRRP